MAEVDSTLLSPEGAVLTNPEDVDEALLRLWDELGRQAAGAHAPKPAVSRVCLANLIVVGREQDGRDQAGDLAELATVFPSRTIVLLVGEQPDPAVRASISAVCHLPQPGEPQVCCEQIVLRCSPRPANDLLRTILPLLAADLPLMGWWTMDPSVESGFLQLLCHRCDRLVISAGPAGLRSSEPFGPCIVRELGWYRVRRWRELVADLFDPHPGAAEGVEEVVISAGAADEAAESWLDPLWLLAFMAGQLNWTPDIVARQDDFTFARPGRPPVRAKIRRGHDASSPGVTGIRLAGAGRLFQIDRCRSEPGACRVMTGDETSCALARTVRVPPPTTSGALAEALAGRRVDAAFVRALPVMRRLVSPISGGA